MRTQRGHRRPLRIGIATVVAGASLLASGGVAQAAEYPSDSTKPDLVKALQGYYNAWQPSGKHDMHGRVVNPRVTNWNDRVTSWINQNSTKDQQFRALQNAMYLADDRSGYDQSTSIADGLGQTIGRYYAEGRRNGRLPKVDALLNATDGTSGAYINTDTAKDAFYHPRPYLAADPSVPAIPKEDEACAPSKVNASSYVSTRKGHQWANPDGSLKITRLAPVVDRTHQFSNSDVVLWPAYGDTGLCTGGSFPSGHTTTVYQAGITLATLLPELAPEILTRSSEAANNRMTVGVHYSLDIIGGRISGQAAIASRASDATYRKQVLEPARAELRAYLEKRCGTPLARCIAKDKPYRNNPYGGKAIPGGTAQIVYNRQSAVKVYTERLEYGHQPTQSTRLAPSVPTGAENLLLDVYPGLNATQRRAILAQTETRSGQLLDTTKLALDGKAPGSWQRLNLAAAMSATVRVDRNGAVKVISTGGQARVIKDRVPAGAGGR
ncbi:phosphatase PAP2 family protein [Acidipropionibacterium virtanenii]|uniref:Major phosphate-irrepressible acid phosphatase n=1 Tax=Acidipropionibacterium virtanenii TaxID=2057246 RepID=A0A344UXQ8_9ACTN|nr:phosphatase PAP2 family protein [Acidipropionibacterium virtanenii]AXE40056.1 Major phosphate-irrepressible acid phosphatase [Acidipropionibacterium virtanenii]